MCVQTHQLTTGPNGITSGLRNIWQDFQNHPVLCNWSTPCSPTVQILLSPWTFDLIQPLLLFQMHPTSLISMLCQWPQLTSHGGTVRPRWNKTFLRHRRRSLTSPPVRSQFRWDLHKFHSWHPCDQMRNSGRRCPCMFAFCGVGWHCLSLARSHVSVDAHVKCSSKIPPIDPSSKHRMSVVILLPSLPWKIVSPRGLSDTPWGFTTHSHNPLSLVMFSTFTSNFNPNQPCFYLSDLSSPIFSFYILFI